MANMNKNRRRGLASALSALGLLAACSVDTTDVNFVPDDVLSMTTGDTGTGATGDTGSGGALATGGVSNVGGVVNVAGVLNKAGSSGKAGASNGGSNALAGAPTGGMAQGGSGGGGGMMGCPMAKGDPRQPVIDDFTDGDAGILMRAGRAGGWYVTNDGKGTQMPPNDVTRPPKPDSPGFDMAGYALHTQGSGFSLWGAGYGVSLSNAPGQYICTYDVSPHTGIRFYTRGKITGMDAALHFHLVTAEIADREHGGTCDATTEKCFDNYAFDINPVPADWKLFEIPFASLKQAGWGTPKKLYLTHVLNLEFTTGVSANFDFWIDQIEFY